MNLKWCTMVPNTVRDGLLISMAVNYVYPQWRNSANFVDDQTIAYAVLYKRDKSLYKLKRTVQLLTLLYLWT